MRRYLSFGTRHGRGLLPLTPPDSFLSPANKDILCEAPANPSRCRTSTQPKTSQGMAVPGAKTLEPSGGSVLVDRRRGGPSRRPLSRAASVSIAPVRHGRSPPACTEPGRAAASSLPAASSLYRPPVGRDTEVGVQLLLLVAPELRVLVSSHEPRRAVQLALGDVGPVAPQPRVVPELAPGDDVAVVGEAGIRERHHHVGDLAADLVDHQALDGPGVPALAVVDRRALDPVALDQRVRRSSLW